jgi:hypothetical protein
MNEHFFYGLFSLIGLAFVLAGGGCIIGCAFMIAQGTKRRLIFDMAKRANLASIVWSGSFMIAYAFDHAAAWGYVSAAEFVIFLGVRVWMVSRERHTNWDA